MARLIAIEWDQQELRLAAGSRHGSTVSIDTLLSHPFPANDALSAEELEARVSEKLRELVNQNGLGKTDAVIAAGRAAIELRSLVLPLAEDGDLPDMVRFQAQRSFAQLSDNSPLDFIKLPVENAESTHVLAAAMNPLAFAKAKRMAEQAGLVPKRVLLRPLASVAMAIAADPSLGSESVLIVNVIGDEADLLVAQQGTICLIRTVRLPSGENAARLKSLASEIKRTRIASESQTPAVRPTRLAIWGTMGIEGNAKDFEEQTGLPTTALDLLASIEFKGKQLPEGSIDRFAPVAGMLLQGTHNDRRTIDFMEPRRRPDKKTPVVEYSLVGGLAAVLVFSFLGWYISSHRAMDAEIKKLTLESSKLNKSVDAAKLKIDNYGKVQKFLQSDIQWLDELAWISRKSPDAEAMMFKGQVTLSMDTTSGKGLAKGVVVAMDNGVTSKFRSLVNDDRHIVSDPKTSMINSPDLPYKVESVTNIEIAPYSVEAVENLLERPSLPKPPPVVKAKSGADKKAPPGRWGEGTSSRRSRRGGSSNSSDTKTSPDGSPKEGEKKPEENPSEVPSAAVPATDTPSTEAQAPGPASVESQAPKKSD